MSRPSAGDVVRAHLDAFSAGDLPGVLAGLAPDAVFVSGTTLVPPQEFEEFFGWAMRELQPRMTITNLIVDGRRVACQFVESLPLADGAKQLDRAAFYSVDNDLITSVKVYDERD